MDFFGGVLFVDLKFFEVSKCSSKNYAKVSGFLVEEFTNNNKKSWIVGGNLVVPVGSGQDFLSTDLT